jgi:pimeloyl-ACP methyl ester carboxylesterase
MEMVEVDGLQIAYERVGSGPPLVLLHGYVGTGQRRGGDSSTGSATSSRSSRGTPQGPVAQPTRPNGSAWMATPAASPDSSTS